MMDFENRLGIEKNPKYAQEILGLKERINQVYFDKELGGYYHDSAHTIKTKYANIFAIILDFTDEEQKAIISEKFTDKEFAEIYTPYMKFYELCALAESGKIDYVIDYIDYYWGGMLEHGATTFWERYNPNEIGNEKYESLAAAINVNFIDEDCLYKLINYAGFELTSKKRKVDTLLSLREKRELTQEDIITILGITKNDELYYSSW